MAKKVKQIGHYQLLKEIGRGGMGLVFKAKQITLNRVVALKILPTNLAKDKVYVQRFLREARSAAKCNHPNLTQIYDVDHIDGIYFFSMEFVDGPNLRQVLKEKGALPQKQALKYMLHIANALREAHDKELVHRDVKPENILLTSEGKPKLTDLGLAKPTKTNEESAMVSSANTVIGTVHFMSPEQCQGQELDGRSDLYSLGATFFQLMTGQTPFDEDEVASMLMAHINNEPPAPSDINEDISPEMDAIILKLLEKDPADRYEHAGMLIEDLEDLSAGKKTRHVKINPELLRRRKRAAPKKNSKSLIPILAVAGILLVAILAYALIGSDGDDSTKQAHQQEQIEEEVTQVSEEEPVTLDVEKEKAKDKPQEKKKPVDNQAKKMFDIAKNYEEKNPDQFEKIIEYYNETKRVGKNSEFGIMADIAMNRVRENWQKKADFKLKELTKEVDGLIINNKFDASLELASAFPENLEEPIRPKLKEFKDHIRNQADKKIGDILLKAKNQFNEKEFDQALSTLNELEEISYASGLEKISKNIELLKSNIDTAKLKEIEKNSEWAAKQLGTYMADFYKMFGDEEYLQAESELNKLISNDKLKSVKDTLLAAKKVNDIMLSRYRMVENYFFLRKDGEKVKIILNNRRYRTGRVKETSSSEIVLEKKPASGPTKTYRIPIKDMSKKQIKKYSKDWKIPDDNDGKIVHIMVELNKKDLSAANKIFSSIDDHPLKVSLENHLQSHMKNLAAVNSSEKEKLAKVIFEKLLKKAKYVKSSTSKAKKLHQEFKKFKEDFAKSKFLSKNNKTIEETIKKFELIIQPPKLKEGLISWWKLDEKNGTTVHDSSETENHGTLNGGNDFSGKVKGKVGAAMKFNGKKDHIIVKDHNSYFEIDQFTISFWIKATSNKAQYIINKGYRFFNITLGTITPREEIGDGKLRIRINGLDKELAAKKKLAINKWQHIAFNYDGETIKYFLNGIPAESVAVKGKMLPQGFHIYFGTHVQKPIYFNGYLDDIRLYNRPLKKQEVHALYLMGE